MAAFLETPDVSSYDALCWLRPGLFRGIGIIPLHYRVPGIPNN
jgi:hypothetical protein